MQQGRGDLHRHHEQGPRGDQGLWGELHPPRPGPQDQPRVRGNRRGVLEPYPGGGRDQGDPLPLRPLEDPRRTQGDPGELREKVRQGPAPLPDLGGLRRRLDRRGVGLRGAGHVQLRGERGDRDRLQPHRETPGDGRRRPVSRVDDGRGPPGPQETGPGDRHRLHHPCDDPREDPCLLRDGHLHGDGRYRTAAGGERPQHHGQMLDGGGIGPRGGLLHDGERNHRPGGEELPRSGSRT